MKFHKFLAKSEKILNSIKRDCLKYEPINKGNNKEKIIKEKLKIVDNTIKSIKDLSIQ
jgi:hypothetical protein